MADRDASSALIPILTESMDGLSARGIADLQDESGYTPLHLAAKHGNPTPGEQLLEAGAEANTRVAVADGRADSKIDLSPCPIRF